MNTILNTKLNLLDFGIVDDNEFTISELLHTSYTRGREDVVKEIEIDFQKNLQSAAQSASLLKFMLVESKINVKDMYIKVVDYNTFKCLVVIDKKDYFNKEKRVKSYKTSQHINSTNSRIELDFSIMAFSDNIEIGNIVSDGFMFKYGTEKV